MSDDKKADVEVKKAASEIEEAELDAYMEATGSNGESISDKDRKSYFVARYESVKATYKFLKLQKDEVEGYKTDKREKALADLSRAFRENYQERTRVVSELRKIGEKIEDPFVAFSKV